MRTSLSRPNYADGELRMEVIVNRLRTDVFVLRIFALPNVRAEARPTASRAEARITRCCSAAGCWASPLERVVRRRCGHVAWLPMRSKKPIPRSPRNVRREPEVQKKRVLVWLGRALWAIGGICATTIVAFVSQGPDSVRKIPEIPSALIEMASKTWDDYRIARELSKTWEFLPSTAEISSGQRPFRLVIQSKDGAFLGELHSPSVRAWTIYDMALVEGRRDGPILRLTVFDFVFGERKEFAKMEVMFQEVPSDGITDHLPALVLDELPAKTTWQLGSALPLAFTLRPPAK